MQKGADGVGGIRSAVQRHWILLQSRGLKPMGPPSVCVCVCCLQASLETLDDLATAGCHSLLGNHQGELNSGCPLERGYKLGSSLKAPAGSPHTLMSPNWSLVPFEFISPGIEPLKVAGSLNDSSCCLGMTYSVSSQHPECRVLYSLRV